MERILYSKNAMVVRETDSLQLVDPQPEQVEDILIACAPCFGRCPTCRQQLHLFDLTKYDVDDGDDDDNEVNSDTSENGSSTSVRRETGQGSETAYEKEYGIGPLGGCVFMLDGHLGLGSLHFSRDESDDTNDGENEIRPYVSYESEKLVKHMGCMDDGSTPPSRVYFSDGFHFHRKSNTFLGSIEWKNITWYGSYKWDYVVQFSSNLQHVCGGCIIMHRDTMRPFNDHKTSDDKQQQQHQTQHVQDLDRKRHRQKRPCSALDGVWKVAQSKSIQIVSGAFAHEPLGYNYRLDFTSSFNVSIKFHKGEETIVQYNDSCFDFERHPEGPAVGDCMSWRANIPSISQMQWTRESVITSETPLSPKIVPFGVGGKSLRRYVATVQRHSSSPTYDSEVLWGNTFIQARLIGLASYHFISPNEEEGAYISYEHPETAFWGALDDGSPLPARVPFRNIEFDRESRTFRGMITWKADFGASWHGSVSWEYEMVFDAEYRRIESGGVRNFLEGNVESTRHLYGETLFYLNAYSMD